MRRFSFALIVLVLTAGCSDSNATVAPAGNGKTPPAKTAPEVIEPAAPARFERLNQKPEGMYGIASVWRPGGDEAGYIQRGSRAYLVCRLATHYGPPRAGDQSFAYFLRDKETGVPLMVDYSELTGAIIWHRVDVNDWGAAEEERERAQPAVEALLRLLENTEPGDCTIDYTSKLSKFRSGTKDGRVFHEPNEAFADAALLEERVLAMVAAARFSKEEQERSDQVRAQRRNVVRHGRESLASLFILLRHPQVNVRRGAAFALSDLVLAHRMSDDDLLTIVLDFLVEETDIKCRSNLASIVRDVVKLRALAANGSP